MIRLQSVADWALICFQPKRYKIMYHVRTYIETIYNKGQVCTWNISIQSLENGGFLK